jgi:hypothetical protein
MNSSSIDLIYRHQKLIIGKLTDQRLEEGASSNLVIDVIMSRYFSTSTEQHVVGLDEKWRVQEMMS